MAYLYADDDTGSPSTRTANIIKSALTHYQQDTLLRNAITDAIAELLCELCTDDDTVARALHQVITEATQKVAGIRQEWSDKAAQAPTPALKKAYLLLAAGGKR